MKNTNSRYLAAIAAFFLLILPAVVRAEKVTMTNAEASRLLVALRTTTAGTTAANTRNGALAVNALRPFVEAYEAGQRSIAVRAGKIAETDPAKPEKIAALQLEADKLNAQTVTVDVPLFSLSDDEIRDAKVPMDALAEMLRHLSPKK